MGTKKRTNEEWVELYREQRRSGFTMKAWCAENGVNVNTMADRLSRLRKLGLVEVDQPATAESGEKTRETPSWMEVREAAPHAANGIDIKVGSFSITVSEEFQEASLIRVCRALMSLC